MDVYHNVAEILRFSAKKFPKSLLWGTKVDGEYEWINYATFERRVRRLRSAMLHLGITKGDKIGIIARNSENWACVAYAAYGLGAIIVPMYEVQKISDWEFILSNSQVRSLFVANEAIARQIEELNISTLQNIFSFSVSDPADKRSFSQFLESETEYQDILPRIGDRDPCDIIYTSGTTGLPKGVVLTHEGVITNVVEVRALFPIDNSDRTLSFLPWAHAFGKTVELHLFVSVGASIGLVESSRTIAKNIIETNPSVLIGVPKIFNKFYEGIQNKIDEMPGFLKSLLNRTRKPSHKSKSTPLTRLEAIQYKVLDTILAEKIRRIFGTRPNFCITGGAALSCEVLEFFEDFGIHIYEGYGMTEVSPIVSVNYPGHCKFGSVGKPIKSNRIKVETISEVGETGNGEILVYGPCVMEGYFEAPESNLEAFSEDHGFRTGDMGFLDDDGYLWLTGRIKEQYKLENGKYVVPGALEKKIVTSPKIENAVIFGDGKPYNVILIQPAKDFIQSFIQSHELDATNTQAIETHPELRLAIQTELDIVCKDFRGYEKPQKFDIIIEEFSIQNGLLSPALKVKRKAVAKLYETRLNAMYVNK